MPRNTTIVLMYLCHKLLDLNLNTVVKHLNQLSTSHTSCGLATTSNHLHQKPYQPHNKFFVCYHLLHNSALTLLTFPVQFHQYIKSKHSSLPI